MTLAIYSDLGTTPDARNILSMCSSGWIMLGWPLSLIVVLYCQVPVTFYS